MFMGQLSPASNRATWSDNYELTDAETGDEIDISAVDEITLAVRDPQTHCIVLSGTKTGGEITFSSDGTDGIFQWEFSADTMSAICAKTYEVGCTIEEDGQTVQLLIGSISIFDGIVA